MTSNRIPLTPCPSCGKLNDAATHPTQTRMPAPGDFSVCGYCGELLIFNEGLSMRRAELNDLMPVDARTHRAIEQMQAAFRLKHVAPDFVSPKKTL